MPKVAPCPLCSSTNARRVFFTALGSVIGPYLLHHVRCRDCGAAYNGRTGRLNDTAIAVYVAVAIVVVIALAVGAWFVMQRMSGH